MKNVTLIIVKNVILLKKVSTNGIKPSIFVSGIGMVSSKVQTIPTSYLYTFWVAIWFVASPNISKQ